MTTENLLVDPSGTLYAKLYVRLSTVHTQSFLFNTIQSSTFYLGAKATGEKFSKVIAGPPQGKPAPKDKAPTHVVKDQTTPEQAITFRLSGDYNPLHVGMKLSRHYLYVYVRELRLLDPKIGKGAGFGGTILHGLCTFGFAARAVLKAVGGNDAKSLKFFSVRFTAPVKPGDALETQIWEVGPGPKGTTEVAFVTKDLNTGKVSYMIVMEKMTDWLLGRLCLVEGQRML